MTADAYLVKGIAIINIFLFQFKTRYLFAAESMCCMFFSPTSQHRTAISAYGFILQYVRNNHTLLSANPVRGSFGIHILRPCLCCWRMRTRPCVNRKNFFLPCAQRGWSLYALLRIHWHTCRHRKRRCRWNKFCHEIFHSKFSCNNFLFR